MNIFKTSIINLLLTILGWVVIVGAAIFFLTGFFVTLERGGTNAYGLAGYLLGYEVTGLAMFAFIFCILAILHKLNNKSGV